MRRNTLRYSALHCMSLRATGSATFMSSTAVETMPPAQPAFPYFSSLSHSVLDASV